MGLTSQVVMFEHMTFAFCDIIYFLHSLWLGSKLLGIFSTSPHWWLLEWSADSDLRSHCLEGMPEGAERPDLMPLSLWHVGVVRPVRYSGSNSQASSWGSSKALSSPFTHSGRLAASQTRRCKCEKAGGCGSTWGDKCLMNQNLPLFGQL